MTRSFFSVIAVGIVGFALSPALMAGCKATGVGDPCTPEQEYNPGFLGFSNAEVDVESKSFQCQTRLCLVNHFQGRVSCPYGQTVDATTANQQGASAGGFTCGGSTAPNQQTPCCTPGVAQTVLSDQDCPPGSNGDCTPKSMITQSQVPPNCTDRTSDKAVYCSCRCANPDGKTDDGANYCQCPDGFSCTQLIEGVGIGDPGLQGAYCVKNKTQFDKQNSCHVNCNALAKSGASDYCGPVNAAH